MAPRVFLRDYVVVYARRCVCVERVKTPENVVKSCSDKLFSDTKIGVGQSNVKGFAAKTRPQGQRGE